jgi:two-component system OmpR family sensor kinase/two-component system sensor histidine kinase BaeS
MAEQLTRQQQQQRQLIADIAHDLRTPLSVMTLEVAGIRAGLQTPEEATTSLQEEIDWLQHLIDDLHTLSLMDTGRLSLRFDDTALTPYLTTLGNQWQSMAIAQNKTLHCELPSDLPVIQIDPFRLRQVLGNLLNNALQHTPPGTNILLRAQVSAINPANPAAASNPPEVVITVADNGPGIPEADVQHIFERFYRADRARNRSSNEHGSGLGLSIAYQLVALHGGLLDVKSAPGKGTAFYIHLPLSQPKSS